MKGINIIHGRQSLCVLFNIHCFLFLAMLMCFEANARATWTYDGDTTKVTKSIKLRGGIQLQSSIYTGKGNRSFQNPFGWSINANATLSIKQWSFPFNAAYSKNNRTFSHPFVRYGVSPQIKSLKFHLGYRSLQFSNYAFSSVPMLGAGFEFKPKVFYIGFMMGQLQKQVKFDTSSQYYTTTPHKFKRQGYAAKIGVHKGRSTFNLTYFKAWDKDDTLGMYNPTLNIRPAANTALGTELILALGRHVYIGGLGGASIYTRNIRSVTNDTIARSVGGTSIPSWARSIDKNINATSQYLIAYELKAGFNTKIIDIDFSYKHVSPDFKTMGTFYFQADNEQITVSPSLHLSKKFSLNGSIGLQSNNLLGKKNQTTRNKIYAINMQYNPSEKLQTNINYSNFGSTIASENELQVDSLSIRNINSSINANVQYTIAQSKEATKQISFNFANQSSEEVYEYNPFAGNDFSAINGNLQYRHSINIKKRNWNVGVNFNQNKNIIPSVSTQLIEVKSYGASIGYGQSFLSKDRLMLYANLTINTLGEVGGNSHLSIASHLSGRIKLTKKQQFNLSMGYNTSKIRNTQINQLTTSATLSQQF